MSFKDFVPHHMNIDKDDLMGNGSIGRYIILPGSNGRAEKIAGFFDNVEVKKHPRCHNFFKGTIDAGGRRIDVATVASGMGSPSIDIIVNELYRLGARRIIRVGTSGSLQPSYIRVGSVVIPVASVRDEGTTSNYIPQGVPAVASLDFVEASKRACNNLKIEDAFFGVVHSKDSLYAREFKEGPMAEENKRYMELLKASGVLASEMECSLLFTLGMVFDKQLKSTVTNYKDYRNLGPGMSFKTGAVLAIIGDDSAFSDDRKVSEAIEKAVKLGLETVRELAKAELA